MPGKLKLIDDEDLQAPLELAKNYEKLAKEFDEVASSTAKLVKQIQDQDANLAKLNQQTETLQAEVKKLEKAQAKSAKSTEAMAVATEWADKATGGLVSQVKNLFKQLGALVATPWGAALMLIAAALGSVAAYFKSTNEGADKFERIMAGLGGVLDSVIQRVAAVGKELSDLFSSTDEEGGVISDFFFGLMNKIMATVEMLQRFLGMLNILKKYNLRQIIMGDFSEEDIKKLKKELLEFTKAWVTSNTGIAGKTDDLAEKYKQMFEAAKEKQKLEAEQRDRILTKAEEELAVSKLMFIVKDKINATDEERLAALMEITAIQEKGAKTDISLAMRQEHLYAAQVLAKHDQIKSTEEINAIIENGLTPQQEALFNEKAMGEEVAKRKQLQADILAIESKNFDAKVKNLKIEQAIRAEIEAKIIRRANKDVNDRLADFEKLKAGQQKHGEWQMAFNDEVAKDSANVSTNMNQRFIEDRVKRDEQIEEMTKENMEKLMEQLEQERAVRFAVATASLQALQDLGNEFFDRGKAKREEESADIEERRATQLSFVEDDERKKLAINRKFDREQAKIKTKQAQADKNKALFNIAIGTGMSIITTMGNLGLPLAIPFIAIAAAMGAIQLALVASRPLPKFAKGTQNAPNLFLAGEKGRELIAHNGESMLVDKPTIFSGLGGAQVYSNLETEGILGAGPALLYGSKLRREMTSRDRVVETLSENNRWLKKIANKEEVGLVVDEEGFHKYSNRVARRNRRINERFYGT